MIIGLPNVKKERYIKYIRTVLLLIPSFLPNQEQTPNALCSNQRRMALIIKQRYALLS